MLQAMRARVPDFALLSVVESQTLSRAAATDPRFLHAAINAIAASPSVGNALGHTGEELRQALEFTDRWSQVVIELEALRSGVLGAMKVRRHRIGGKALQAYQMCRQLARYGENADLRPHIDAMRRAARLNRSRLTPVLPPTVPEVPPGVPEGEVAKRKV